MRLFVDEQMPPLLAQAFRERGLEAAHASDYQLVARSDDVIWRFACSEEWIVVSKDADYPARLSARPPHCPVLWVRVGNATNRLLIDTILRDLDAALAAFESGALLVEIR